jgi:hypothetical protein
LFIDRLVNYITLLPPFRLRKACGCYKKKSGHFTKKKMLAHGSNLQGINEKSTIRSERKMNFKGFGRKKSCISEGSIGKIPSGFKSFKIHILFLHSKGVLSSLG